MAKANPDVTWYIKYRFYELGKERLPVVIKGMNDTKDLKEKQAITQSLIDDELADLKVGYNPNLKRVIAEINDTELSPTATLYTALHSALTKIKLEKHTREVIKSSLNNFLKAAKKISLSDLSIKEATFKQYRSDLDFNPVDEFLEKRKIVHKIPEALSKDPRIVSGKYLPDNYYTFWRFQQVFYHLCAQIIELLRVKKMHVCLDEQKYKALIKKGQGIF